MYVKVTENCACGVFFKVTDVGTFFIVDSTCLSVGIIIYLKYLR